MKKWAVAVLVTLSLLVGTLTLFTARSSSAAFAAEPGHATPKTYWACPMHHQIHESKPGHCPICGMTLVNVEDDSARSGHQAMPDGHAPIKLSMNREQMIGVTYGTVEKKLLFKTIRAAGRVAYDPELYTAQNDYQEAVNQMDRVKDSTLPEVRHSAERMLQSSKLRLKILGLSDKQIAALARGNPTSEQGLLIHQAGQDVYIYAEIYEMDLPDVLPGLEAELTASFLGGHRLTGTVVSVDRVLNASSRTAKARILVPKARAQLRPESYVDVSIRSPLGMQVTVPFDAVLETGTQDWIFVKTTDARLEPRLITIKYRAGDEIAVESGVEPGERIATSANFLIDSESRLKAEMTETPNAKGAPQATPSKTPACRAGAHWDRSMAMCMSGGD
jgi:Cu(I)/Ag(I) efflux system membrane fusion protein